MEAPRPLPEVTPLTAPFWEALRRRRLVLQRCHQCGRLRFPPEYGCFYCGCLDYEWVEVSGKAVLYTWTVTYRPHLPFFAQRLPWPVAVVQLEEGPRMVTNLVDVAPQEYRIGLPLQADFLDVEEGVTLVVFRRREG